MIVSIYLLFYYIVIYFHCIFART